MQAPYPLQETRTQQQEAQKPMPLAASTPASKQTIPDEFQLELDSIAKWGTENEKNAKSDQLAFWTLKIPAIVVSAGAAALVHFKLDDFAMVAAGAASACVLIDGLRPRGLLFGAHMRATHELYKLHADMLSQWRTGVLGGREARSLAAEILKNSAPERDRIAAYLTKIESTSVHDHASAK